MVFQIMKQASFISENIKESGFFLDFTFLCKAIRMDVLQLFRTTIKVKNIFKKKRNAIKFKLSNNMTPWTEDLWEWLSNMKPQ